MGLIGYKVETRGDISKDLRRIANGLQDVIGEAVFDTLEDPIQGQCMRRCPVRIGNLQGSIQVLRSTKAGEKTSSTIGAYTDYAHYVHENLKPNVKWTTTGTGPKFIEIPVMANQGLIAKNIDEAAAKFMEAR